MKILICNAVFITVFFCFVEADDFSSRVAEITTDSGYLIRGNIITLNDTIGPGLLAIHSHGATRDDWQPLLKYLNDGGISLVLAIDVRGHGESTLKINPDGQTDSLTYDKFEPVDYIDITNDIKTVFDFLITLPEVDSSRCGIVGVKSGSVYAVKTARENPKVKFLVLLSPDIIFRAVAINEDIKKIDNVPVLISACDRNEMYEENAEWLYYNFLSDEAKKKLCDCSEGETEILKILPDCGEYIQSWLKKKVR